MKFSKLRKFLVLFLIPLAFVVIFSGTGAVLTECDYEFGQLFG